MVCQDCTGTSHNIFQYLATVPLRKVLPDGLSHNIVRRKTLGIHFLLARVDHKMPVTLARVKMDGLAAKFLIQQFNEDVRLVRFDVSGAEIFQNILVSSNKVTTKRPVSDV